jgi:hypothetical protein
VTGESVFTITVNGSIYFASGIVGTPIDSLDNQYGERKAGTSRPKKISLPGTQFAASGFAALTKP